MQFKLNIIGWYQIKAKVSTTELLWFAYLCEMEGGGDIPPKSTRVDVYKYIEIDYFAQYKSLIYFYCKRNKK